MNNNYDLNNENKIDAEKNNNFIGSTNNDLVNDLNNNSNNLGNYNQTFQSYLSSNGNNAASQGSNVNNETFNNSYNMSNSLNNYNQTSQNNLNNNGNFGNIPYNSTNASNSINLKANKKKNKTGLIIAMIVIAIILLPLGTIALILAITTRNVSLTISTSRLNSIITQYRMIEENVIVSAVRKQPVTCDSDCYNIYDYNKERYDVKVIDKNTYYQVEFRVIDEMYKGINLDSDKCKELRNVVCKGNEITGKVSK